MFVIRYYSLFAIYDCETLKLKKYDSISNSIYYVKHGRSYTRYDTIIFLSVMKVSYRIYHTLFIQRNLIEATTHNHANKIPVQTQVARYRSRKRVETVGKNSNVALGIRFEVYGQLSFLWCLVLLPNYGRRGLARTEKMQKTRIDLP